MNKYQILKHNDGRMLAVEEWVNIKTNPEYFVSNLGNVKKGDRILSQSDSHGYLLVGIYPKTALVHRLVAKAFIPNPENKREVNHINGDKHDNRVINLEWSTRVENSTHANELGLRGKLKPEDVRAIRIMLEKGIKQTTIAYRFKVSPCTISEIKLKRKWKALI